MIATLAKKQKIPKKTLIATTLKLWCDQTAGHHTGVNTTCF
jgi:hypothetical protein